MRSSAGVGTTPPKVPGAPKPTSSVMMSNTLGALRRYDARGPPSGRLRGLLLDHPAELRIGRWKLFSVDCGGGTGRTRSARDLLGHRARRKRYAKKNT